MKKLNNYINNYSVSKTLRFKAIPIGKTQENINIKRILEEDEERAEKYKRAKKIIDKYHVYFINDALSTVILDNLNDYSSIYIKKERTDEEKEMMLLYENKMRKQISDAFKKHPIYKNIFSEKLIKEILPQYLQDEEEKSVIAEFSGFFTAFSGFNSNRENMYSDEPKSTAISYRCINENLPKFLGNIQSFEKIHSALDDTIFSAINNEIGNNEYRVEDCFTSDYFNCVLSADGISFYNCFIGGYTKEDGTKVKGLNEYINLYNQQLGKNDKSKRLPKLKMLYKLILTETSSASFSIDKFENDNEVILAVKEFTDYLKDTISNLNSLIGKIGEYDPEGIVVKNGLAITNIANDITGYWGTFQDAWNALYDAEKMKKTPSNIEKYEEERRKAYRKIGSFSIAAIDNILAEEKKQSLSDYFSTTIATLVDAYNTSIEEGNELLSGEYPSDRKLVKDENAISKIKNILDALKNIENFVKPLMGDGKESQLDELFYGEFYALFDNLSALDRIYDMVRNYVTAKPYSDAKYKLYFQNPQLLGGWDKNKVRDYRSTLLRRDGKYYLLIIDKGDTSILEKLGDDSDETYEVLDYRLVPGASKQLPHIFFSNKGIEEFQPSAEVLRIKEHETFKKGPQFNLDDCHKLIDYYKSAISRHAMQDTFHFAFRDTADYEDISMFYKEVDEQGYSLAFTKVNKQDIDSLVDEGKVYLFQVYNKDFSEKSHGTENLHTMLFKEVFNPVNHGKIKLCGGAELFFRKASILKHDRVIHPANVPINNKNVLNPKKTTTLEYDVIKDKRYTVDQYEVHIPITINRCPVGSVRLNDRVRKDLKDNDNNYVIGIDRGERNLIYLCVIDGKGNIVEQTSLNEIVNMKDDVEYRTDYHSLLDAKEKERKKARQEWTSIENIKELKEGYISQIVHKICSLVIKYDAVIAMEDLNSGFKNSRVKVEKQVYQKFEKALIDKFNYLSDKSIPMDEAGSVVNGYQITNKFESFKSMGTQNGFIFYIPAWLTSKIDPTTGFVDLLKPKYQSVSEAQKYISRFDSIKFNKTENMYEFECDYTKFDRTEASFVKKWTICTNGDRIKTFRNPEKNSEWDSKQIILTDALNDLFSKYGIKVTPGEDLKEKLLDVSEKDFWVEFMGILRLTLQMRNSITGTDVDYLISPVRNNKGEFYDSRNCGDNLPKDADANGAYNIARKVLWAIDRFKDVNDSELGKTKIAISNKEWLTYAQQ